METETPTERCVGMLAGRLLMWVLIRRKAMQLLVPKTSSLGGVVLESVDGIVLRAMFTFESRNNFGYLHFLLYFVFGEVRRYKRFTNEKVVRSLSLEHPRKAEWNPPEG